MSTTALTLALTTITKADKKILDGLIKAESERVAISEASPAPSDEERAAFYAKEEKFWRNMARAGFDNDY